MSSPALLMAGRWAACVLLVAACAEAASALGRRRRPPGGRASRLLRRYDRSERGRRLAGRLAGARIELSPSGWRIAQAMLAVPAAGALHLLGGLSPLGAIGLGAGLVRGGGWALLRARRDRRHRALARAAPPLGRALATELASGRGPAAALAAVARGELVEAHPVLRPMLADAARRVALGADPRSALDMALQADAGRGGPSRDALGMVVAAFTIQAHLGGDHAPLARLADSLEETRRSVEQPRAAVGEPRLVAIAVPALALVAALPVVAANPAALGPALGLPELPILVLCAALAASGVALVLRLTRI